MKSFFIIVFLFIITFQIQGQDYKPENLGPKVNSKYGELAPLISADGKTIYFARLNHPQNTFGESGSQDIWYSELKDGQWTEAKHLDKPFNQEQINFMFNVTPDGNTILAGGAYVKGKYAGEGFSTSNKIKTGWAPLQAIPLKHYEELNRGLYSFAYLTNNRETLLLSYSEQDTGSISDIYVCFLQKDATWSEPAKIRAPISTENDEITPFLAADEVTLYFSSNRKGGYGQNDIWMSKRLDDTWLHWSEPKNLGNTINSEAWEGYYSIDAAGEYAYMVSHKDSYGGTDIVRIKLKEENKPNPVVLVQGRTLNSETKQPIEAHISYETLPSGKESGTARSNPITGDYKIILPYGANYGFTATAINYLETSENLDLTSVAEYKEITQDLLLTPFKVGQTVRLNNIFFDFAKATLRPESFPELDRLVDLLNKERKVNIEIEGHTDNVGSDEANLKLSSDRATAVMDYVISKGISSDRLTAKGFGESMPIASNDDDQGKQLNRRVEFTIVKN